MQKKEEKKIADRSLGPVARQRGGRPPWPPGSGAAGPLPLYKVLAAPSPPFGLLKIQKKKKREGERERRGEVRERQSGEALSDFQAGDFR